MQSQVVEILPWSAVLPNNEKIADIQGHLSSVQSSYKPGKQEFTLTTPLEPDFGDEWATRSDNAELRIPSKKQALREQSPEYLFMRVWNRGSDLESDPKVEFKTDAPIILGKTGLDVTIAGDHLIDGDYWIISTRPETPNIAMPWALEEGLPANGIRRFYAPLAIIQWTPGAEAKVVRDCRKKFRPLTDLETCCTYSVGDGLHTHGDFDSLEDAVQNLPSDGGTICVLPGIHTANLTIVDRSNITIRGCGRNTLIMPRSEQKQSPIFYVKNSQRITLENMDIITLDGIAISLAGAEQDKLKEVEICNNRIMAYIEAIRVTRGININIHHNRISMWDKEGAGVGILAMAEDSRIEHNYIDVVPAREEIPDSVGTGGSTPTDPCIDTDVIYKDILVFLRYTNWIFEHTKSNVSMNMYREYNALGGIQIESGSSGIKMQENEIIGGAGNGIALGSEPPSSVPRGDADIFFDDSSRTATPDLGRDDRKHINGRVVTDNGAPVGDVVVLFRDKIGPDASVDVTDKNGRFRANKWESNWESGTYNVAIKTPGLGITGINAEDNEIIVTVGETDPPSMPALIREIQIDHNEIANMGLSGIGIPHMQQSRESDGFFAELGSPVINLSITQNHIYNCLQSPFDQIKEHVIRRGLGGISLGLCWYLSIHENRIENNGINHIRPVCGLYIAYGEHIDITHNHIINNGSLVSSNARLEPGKRGGIFLELVSSTSIFEQTANGSPSTAKGRLAASIHDNVVDQPAGRSLVIFACGTISVLGNQFSSELSGGGYLEDMAGGVFIFNLGGMQEKGNTLFNSNQTRVGSRNNSSFSQIIYSLDDIGFDGNQSDNFRNGRLISNTLLYGITARATGSRFKEIIQNRRTNREVTKVSLFTVTASMNNTSNNQGNHCIIPINVKSMPPVDLGNQTLSNLDECGKLSNGLNSSLRGSDLEGPLEKLKKARKKVLNNLKELQIINRSFLQYEKIWRVVEFGEGSPRAAEIVGYISHNSDSISLLKTILATAVGISEPTVSDMGPSGTVTDLRPIITANVGNISAAREVILRVDGLLVTTEVGDYASITYTPEEDMADGNHTVELEVVDIAGESVIHSWEFNITQVDTSPPNIYNEKPTGTVAHGDVKISADYSDDGTGIDQSTAIMKIDGNRVDAKPSASGIEYTATFGAGQHTVHVEISDNAGNVGSREWQFTVAGTDEPILRLSADELNFGETEAERSFTIFNAGGGQLNWQAFEGVAWAEALSPKKGSLDPGEHVTIIARVSREGLDQGEYTGSISISSDGGEGKVKMSMAVPLPGPILLTPSSLDFGIEDTEKVFVITNTSSIIVGWRITSKQPSWIIKVDPKGATSLPPGDTENVAVKIHRRRFSPDQYQHDLKIRYNDEAGNIHTVPFTVKMGVSK